MDTIRNISLKCGVCGNTNFEYDEEQYNTIDEAKEVKCTICNKVYIREELVEVNSTLIENTKEEVADEAIRKALKKAGFKVK